MFVMERTNNRKDFYSNLFNARDGEWPQWLNTLIEERYGFKPYKL